MQADRIRSIVRTISTVVAACSVLLASLFGTSTVCLAQLSEASNETTSDPLAMLPPLQGNHARIFFFRESRFVGIVADARIKLDGKTIGWVGSGRAVYVDHLPGDVLVGVAQSDGFEKGDFALTLAPGTEYFITVAARANLGLIGEIINLGINQQHCSAWYCAGVVGREAALSALANMSISGPNPNAN